MRKIIKYCFVVAVLAALVWGFLQLRKIPSLTNIFTPEKVMIENTPVVVKQIQALSQLVTVSMYNEIVADTSRADIEKLKLPLLPQMNFYKHLDRLVVVGKITVHAGIDMQQLYADDISGNRDSLHLRLPRAQILDAIINPSGVDIFIEDGDWNGQAVANMKNKIQNLAMLDAQSRGLLAQSETKAKQILADFFMVAGYKKVVIEMKGKKGFAE